MIEFKNLPPDCKSIEIGGGELPHPQIKMHVDIRPLQGLIDFQMDAASFPWPLSSDEFDLVYCCFLLEHLPFTKTTDFLKEALRILKPGGSFVCITPDTQAQMQWIQDNQNGWDNKDGFTAMSEILFGSQGTTAVGGDEATNVHRSFFSPAIAQRLFAEAGFASIVTEPYGERNTDLCIAAKKPLPEVKEEASLPGATVLPGVVQSPSVPISPPEQVKPVEISDSEIKELQKQWRFVRQEGEYVVTANTEEELNQELRKLAAHKNRP